MDDDAECGSRTVVEFVARARDRATRATATFERAARVWRAVWCERATPVDARSSVARGDARRDRARAWWRMTTRATLTSNLSRAAFVR